MLVSLILLVSSPVADEIAETETGSLGGYDLDELNYGNSFEVVLDDSDLDKLQDDKVEVNDEEYDFHEEIEVTEDAKIIVNGLAGYDVDMGANPYLSLEAKNAIIYRYVFDDAIPVGEIDEDEDEGDSLKINFLGENIEIIDVDSNSIDIIGGTELQLEENEIDEESGITLLSVAENGVSVVVSYNGVNQVISNGETKTLSGTEIYLSEAFAGTNNYAYANLRYGEDIKSTIDDGDEYEEDSDWKYTITVVDDELTELGLTYDAKLDDFDDEELIGLGESFSLPNDFVTMTFKEITPEDINTYSFEFEEYDDEINTLHIESEDVEGIVIDGEEVDEAWYDGTNTYYELDGDDFTFVGAPTLKYDDTEITLTYVDEIIGIDDITFVTSDFKQLGTLAEDSSDDEFKVGTLDISDRDEDTLTTYGTIVYAHEDSDEFEIEFPSAEVEATINFA